MAKTLLIIAAISGLLAVVIGAFAAHGLKGRIAIDLMAVFQTGVQYHFYHALALLLVGILILQFPQVTLLKMERLVVGYWYDDFFRQLICDGVDRHEMVGCYNANRWYGIYRRLAYHGDSNL